MSIYTLARYNNHPTSPPHRKISQTSKLQDVMQLILGWFENSLRPAYTDFHIRRSILTDYNSRGGGWRVEGGGWRGGGGEEREAALQQSLKSYFLNPLAWATASIVFSSAELLSSRSSGPADWLWLSPPLPSLLPSHTGSLRVTSFSYLTTNPENA